MFFVIVGLGNPGDRYGRTRHNLGFWVVDILARRHGIAIEPGEYDSLRGQGTIKAKSVYLVKPQTFMNLSGEAVAPLLAEIGVSTDQLLVVHDDLDLEFGRIQIRKGGGDGGHRGVRSVAQGLNSNDFVRLRLGIGKPRREDLQAAQEQTKEYVLSEFSEEEEQIAQSLADRAADAIELWLEQDLVKAMNTFNPWKSQMSKQETK